MLASVVGIGSSGVGIHVLLELLLLALREYDSRLLQVAAVVAGGGACCALLAVPLVAPCRIRGILVIGGVRCLPIALLLQRRVLLLEAMLAGRFTR